MNNLISRHEQILRDLISQTPIPASRIRNAIEYSLFSGGKRIRPQLVYLCGELMAVDLKVLDMIAAAIELTHCYSLIHDDLPAMDNDDFRRGKPSCHRAFDEATAILAGDALQALATDILLSHLPKLLSPLQVIAVTKELLHASGPQGMVSGQSLDLSELSQKMLDEPALRNIHYLKTGKLILSCINMVLKSCEPKDGDIIGLQTFANHLGLVFQMQDDYLDRYDGSHQGKNRASDLANQKTTYASLYSQNELWQLIQTHFTAAHQALELFGSRAEKLHLLLDSLFIRTRQHA